MSLHDVEWNDRMPWVPGNRWDLVSHREPEAPRVSVIVTHYAQPRELARTLAALQRQDHPADRLEIIVADDGSPEPPVVPHGVRLVRQEDRGFRAAAARNRGAAVATGDVLCFLDADTTPEPEYVRRLSRLPALLPEAVTVGRRRHADLSEAPTDAPIAEVAPPRELTEPEWLVDAYARTGDLLHADDRSYRYVISAVAACSRSFFDEIGGFDESFSSYGGEDWEWAHRAWQAGGILAHVRDAVAWHDGPDWAERDGRDRAAEGNHQTQVLAVKIPVAGSRARGLLSALPDVLVVLPDAVAPSAAFLCVDSVLASFPQAGVVVGPSLRGQAWTSDPRVLIEGDAPVPDARVTLHLTRAVVVMDAGALTDAVASLGEGEVGSLDLFAADGVQIGIADVRRSRRRAQRWGASAAFRREPRTVPGVHSVRDEPHLEAWVGGWGGAGRFV